MVKNLVKKVLSEKRLEKLLRLKQFIKDGRILRGGLRVMPTADLRLGNELIYVSPASSITVYGWRKLLSIYDHANASEREEFRNQAKTMMLADNNSSLLFETGAIKTVFAKNQDLYLELLATAYYAKGDLKRAFDSFSLLNQQVPSAENYLSMARCSMYFQSTESTIAVLRQGLQKYPGNPPLVLSLANTYFKMGDVQTANKTLTELSPGVVEDIKMKAHNLEILSAEVKDALSKKLTVRPVENLGFQKYTEESVQNYWETLFYHFTAKNRFQHGWSDLCFVTEKMIKDYLRKYPDIRNILNFGVFCGVPDFNVAKEFPEKKFIGVDREVKTKQLNESAFNLPNLSFEALDMIDITYDDRKEVKDFIAKEIRNGEMMVFHARTTTLIYPEAVKKFYKSCADLKVKYIALYENMGMSREFMKYFDFDDMPQDAIPFFSIMMIHNYKKYLEDAGYEIIEKEIWTYSDLYWSTKSLYDIDNWMNLGDSHVCLLARLK